MNQKKAAKAEPIYGLNSVQSALIHDPANVLCVYLSAQRQDARLSELAELAEGLGIRCERVEPKVLDKRAASKHHQGVVADYRRPPMASEKALLALVEQRPDCLLLVLDCVQDPHNLGACLRSAAAAGVDAVVLPKDNSATINATVRKASAGTVDQLMLVQVGNLSRCLEQLKAKGVWLFGAAAGESSRAYTEVEFQGGVAIVMGAEGEGLRRRTLQSCDYQVKIPMQASVESLNVSVACGILLFEARRQRGA